MNCKVYDSMCILRLLMHSANLAYKIENQPPGEAGRDEAQVQGWNSGADSSGITQGRWCWPLGRILEAQGCLAQGDFGAAVDCSLWEDSAQAFCLATLTFFGSEALEPLPTAGGSLVSSCRGEKVQ